MVISIPSTRVPLERVEPLETVSIELPRGAPFKTSKQQLIEVFEYLYVKALLRRHFWNIALASKSSRLSRDQLLRLIGKHGLCARCDRSGFGGEHR